jgi:hypothetical protein
MGWVMLCNFSCAPLQKINIFIFLTVNEKPTPLNSIIGVYLVRIILLLIGQGSRPMFPIGWTNVQIRRCHNLAIDRSKPLNFYLGNC